MADSDITVSGLTATGGIGQIALTWDTPVDVHTPDGLPYLQKDVIEVWSSATNNRDVSSQIGEQPAANSFLHSGIDRGASFYYWIRARNRASPPLFGDWFPASSTAGIHGMESNSDVLLSSTGYFKNKNGLIDQWGASATLVDGTANISFPIQFPNQLFTVMIAPTINVGFIFSIDSKNINGFQLSSYGLIGFGSEAGVQRFFDAFPFNWLAKGY